MKKNVLIIRMRKNEKDIKIIKTRILNCME